MSTNSPKLFADVAFIIQENKKMFTLTTQQIDEICDKYAVRTSRGNEGETADLIDAAIREALALAAAPVAKHETGGAYGPAIDFIAGFFAGQVKPPEINKLVEALRKHNDAPRAPQGECNPPSALCVQGSCMLDAEPESRYCCICSPAKRA